MSQLLGRIAKLSSSSVEKQQRLCFSALRSLSTTATPYLLFNETEHRARTPSGETVVDLNLYDPRKDERVKITDQTLPEEFHASVKIGSSRGWVVNKNIHDSKVFLTNIYNPCASVSSHKVISLPPLDESRALVHGISLSASPNQQDCVVAAKWDRSFVSLCRLGDSDWTHIEVPFYITQMTYSVRDRKFYLQGLERKREYEGPIDFINTSSDLPQVSLYQRFPLSDIPKSRLDEVFSILKTEHLVESPSGDSFIVHWYSELLSRGEIERIKAKGPPHSSLFRRKPRGFVVFKQDSEQRMYSYTEDIGDFCIFLGRRSEAFCVSATEYPGLNPNSVYYASSRTGFGFYDISSNTIHEVIDPPPFFYSFHWLAPLQ